MSSGALADDETHPTEAPAPQAVPTEEVPAAKAADPATPTQSFASDREYDRVFNGLQRAIERQDWPLVCDRLLLLQSREAESLTSFQGVVSSVPVAAAHLLESLPEAGLAVYRRLAGPVAQEKLNSAIKRSDAPAILQVARCYRRTEAAEAALQLIIRRHVDLGEWEEATLIAERNASLSKSPAVVRFQAQWREVQQRIQAAQHAPEFLAREFPSQISIWEHLSEVHPHVRESLQTTYRELRESGLGPYPSISLTPISNGVVLCGPAQRTALDFKTGQLLWQRAIPGYMAEWMQNPGDLGDATRRRMFAISVARRVFDESVTSRTVADGQRLYFIETIPRDDPVAKPAKEFEEILPASRVVCVNAASGETIWTFNGEPAGEIYFDGPPAVFGDLLYVLGESEASGSLKLLTLEASTGHPLQTLELSTPLISRPADDHRRGQAARIEIEGGQLICATANGAIISIDPLFGEISWAIRVPRTEHHLRPAEPMEMQLKSSGFEAWDGWQDIQLFHTGDHLLFATPESDVLTALSRRSGRIAWQMPRGGAIHMVSSPELSIVVLIEKTLARGVEALTGRTRWIVAIPQPAGRGVLAGNSYVYPILNRDLARLNLASGHTEYSLYSGNRLPEEQGMLSRNIRPRQLVAALGSLFEFSIDGMRKLQSPEQTLVAARFRSRLEEVLNQIERHDWRAAVPELQRLLDSPQQENRSFIRETLRCLLTEVSRTEISHPAKVQWHSEIQRLAATPLERAIWRQTQARDRLAEQDWPTFLSLWLTCPVDELDVMLPGWHDDTRCRLDRWFQAEATRAFAGLSPVQALAIDQLIDKQLPEMNSIDSTEQQRLRRCLGATNWGADWKLQLPEEVVDHQDWVSRQLQWLELSRHAESEIAARAAERLLRTYQSRGQWLDAQRWLAHLATFPADIPLSAGRTVEDIVQEFSAQVQQAVADQPALAAWPDRQPAVRVRTSNSREVMLLPIPVDAPAGSFFARINVEMDYPVHAALRFNGSRWSRPWYQKLPKTDRNLRIHPELDRAWGLEQFCLLQTGSEIFGMTPFNQKDLRNSRQIWPPKKTTIDTLGSRGNLMLSLGWFKVDQRPGFQAPLGRFLDEFGHHAAAVGPVRPGYFCIQQMGMLVALETCSGQELWRRYDLPQQAFVCGDDEQVAVISPLTKTVIRYSAIDGSELGRRDWPHALEDVINQSGLRLLLVHGDQKSDNLFFSGDETEAAEKEAAEKEQGAGSSSERVPVVSTPVVLEQRDVESGEAHWKKEWPAGSLPFEIDNRLLGMLGPEGHVEFLLLDKGETVREHSLSGLGQIERIVCSVAEHDFIVVFSRPGEPTELNSELQMLSRFRRPLIRGIVCCFDRQTGGLRWQQELQDSIFRLDQPVDLPVFVVLQKAAPILMEPEPQEELEPQEPVAPVPVGPDDSAPEPPPAEPEKAIPNPNPTTPTAPEQQPGAEEPGQPVVETIDEETEADRPVEFIPPGFILRCYDRRTGKLLHELKGEKSQYAITGDRQKQLVTLITVQTRLEIDFSEDVKEPAE